MNARSILTRTVTALATGVALSATLVPVQAHAAPTSASFRCQYDVYKHDLVVIGKAHGKITVRVKPTGRKITAHLGSAPKGTPAVREFYLKRKGLDYSDVVVKVNGKRCETT